MEENMKRQCGECTACCEGTLSGEAYGYKFYTGRPCHFFNKKCTIYENRPEHPCKNFYCEWLTNDQFPEWMKPNLSKIIVSKHETNNIHYYGITEVHEPIKADILNWVIQWSLNNQHNIKYSILGGNNYIGSKEFVEANL